MNSLKRFLLFIECSKTSISVLGDFVLEPVDFHNFAPANKPL
jgi:hypothetical protein